jgi:hypothetical protein
VESLVRPGPAILFSAAIPYQRGMGHMNEQRPEYWVGYFERREYVVIDCLRRKIWQNDNVEPFYSQNMLIFANRDRLEQQPSLKREYELAHTIPLSIVHPKIYLTCAQAADPRNMSPRRLSAALPTSAKNAPRRRTRRS